MSSRQSLEYLKKIDIPNQFTVFGYVREIASRLSHQKAISQIIPYLCLSYYFHGEFLSNHTFKYIQYITLSNDRMTITRKPLYKPGQTKDTPLNAYDGTLIFYESLYKEDPNSELAEIWLMDHGCFDENKQKILVQKYGEDKTERFPKHVQRRTCYGSYNIVREQSYGAILIPSKPKLQTIASWKFKINRMVYVNSICISIISVNSYGECGEVYYGVFDSGSVNFQDDCCMNKYLNKYNEAKSFKEGDVIMLTLDTTKRTIFYRVNEERSQHLFDCIKQEHGIEYKLGVQLLSLGASVSLLGFSLITDKNFD